MKMHTGRAGLLNAFAKRPERGGAMKTGRKRLVKRTAAAVLAAVLLAATLPLIDAIIGAEAPFSETVYADVNEISEISMLYGSFNKAPREYAVYGEDIAEALPVLSLPGGSHGAPGLNSIVTIADKYWVRVEDGQRVSQQTGDFYAGTYQLRVILRMEGDNAAQNNFADMYTLHVTGGTGSVKEDWTVGEVYNWDTMCTAVVYSPAFELTVDTSRFCFVDKEAYDIELAVKGKEVRFSVADSATGGTKPYTFSLVPGTGPSWLTVGSDGTIQGTPPSADTKEYDLQVRVRDSNNRIPVHGDITIKVWAVRTEITTVKATSNLESICVAGGSPVNPSFTVTSGKPAAFKPESGHWEAFQYNPYYDEKQWMTFHGSAFEEGEKYRWRCPVAIDWGVTGEANKYTLSDPCTVMVDDNPWENYTTMGRGPYFSYAYVQSPAIVAQKSAAQSGRTYVIASAKDTNYALDVWGGSFMPKANVDIYKRNNSEGQAFILTQLSDGYWQIKNYKGTVLDINGGSTANSANVQTYTWNGTDAQKFKIQLNSDGTVTFINKKSGKALDIYGGKIANKQNVQQYTPNGTAAQKWRLIDVTDQMNTKYPKTFEGTKTIASAVNSGFVLDINGASKNNKANVQLYKSNNTNAQKFELTYRGDGLYSVTNKNSGKVLDVAGGKGANGQNVWQYAWNGSKAQLWKLVNNSDGTVTFQSAVNNSFVLDVYGGKAQNKQNVQIYTSNNSKAQMWVLS